MTKVQANKEEVTALIKECINKGYRRLGKTNSIQSELADKLGVRVSQTTMTKLFKTYPELNTITKSVEIELV